jgi:hypothetical protein
MEKITPVEPTYERKQNGSSLSWSSSGNLILGKLKLKSMERTNIFYEEWVRFIKFDAGIPDFLTQVYTYNPLSLNRNKMSKKVDVPIETTVIQGIFESAIGEAQKERFNIALKIKIMIWVETDEDANGIEFDFQKD